MCKGVALSLLASVLFASLYYFASLLRPLDGEAIFSWRMLLTLPCITVFLVLTQEWHHVAQLATRVRRNPNLALGLVASSMLLGGQLWLFLWAPINGRGLQVSLGYFLLPLVMLAVGRYVYRERISTLQKLAAATAAVGVAHEIVRIQGLSWEAMLVALGLPLYFILRRKLRTDNVGGFWFDMALTLPLAAWLLWSRGETARHFAQAPLLFVLVPMLAVLSTAAFMSYMAASRRLPLSLFGLLGYAEPALMVVASLLLGERISQEEWLTYVPIWTAILLLAADGVRGLLGRGVSGKP